jgi:hypothetical protein
MSQMRAMRKELRAIVAVAAVCALIFGLLVAGAMHRPRGIALNDISQQRAHVATCHGLAGHLDANGSSTPANDGQRDNAACPYCCLAALAGSVVLPERLATIARPARASSPISYYAFSAREPETTVSNSANGARAPPAES